MSRKYLGTDLSPAEYYRAHAADYDNPHADAVAIVLGALAKHLHGVVIDIGCGDGLASKLLAPAGFTCVGVDRYPAMVERYRAETGFECELAGFGDAMPRADSAVASYALHLATAAELAVLWSNLRDAGVATLVTISPFKNRPPAPDHYFEKVIAIAGNHGPAGKTVHGGVFLLR